VSVIRVLLTASAVLTRTVYVDETLTDASAGLAVTVTRLDGTVVAGPTAATHGSTGVYTYTLPAQSALDILEVEWVGLVGGATVTLTDRVEIVGGFLFGLAEARGSDSSLSDPLRYTTADLADKRMAVELECERICGWAFVPRFERVITSGDGSNVLPLPWQKMRTIRAISTRYQPGATTIVTPLTDIALEPGGRIVRYDGGIFPAGTSNIVVEFEHGWDNPPEDLKDKAMYRLRSLLNLTRSGVPDRVSSYSTPDGAVYRITLPTRGSTGIPEVDAVYSRYEAPPLGFA
jgi:hypothetical protein